MSRNYFASMTTPSTYPYTGNYGFWTQPTETSANYLEPYRMTTIAAPGHGSYGNCKFVEPDSTQSQQDFHTQKKVQTPIEIPMIHSESKSLDLPSPILISRPHYNSKRKPTPVQEERKDDHYWDRRNRNNESAKKSRLNRKMREDEAKYRCEQLQAQNFILRQEHLKLRQQLEELHRQLALSNIPNNR